jgi:hypothetical protein
MKKSQLRNIIKEEISRLNESKTLQLTAEEVRRLKYILEQKIIDWEGSPDFWKVAIIEAENILKKLE